VVLFGVAGGMLAGTRVNRPRVAGGCPPLSDVQISATGSTVVCPNSTGGVVTVTDTGGCNNGHQWGYRTVSGGPITNILWQTGSTYTINGADYPGVGTHYLVETTTSQDHSVRTSNEIPVTVGAAPAAVATGSAPACSAGSTPLHGSGAANCRWSPLASLSDPDSCDPIARPFTTTTYSLTVSDGTGCASTNTAQVTVTVDATCSGPFRFHTVQPCRVFDTRLPPASPAPFPHGTQRVIPLQGYCGIPSSARALAVNVTVTDATADGFLVIYPTGGAFPGSSAINWRTGQTRANHALFTLGTAGQLAVYCGGQPGQTHVILDVSGYFE
jgi:hypothetical protein